MQSAIAKSTHQSNGTVPSCGDSPAPGSLRAIIVKNNQTRLYTHPLLWNKVHLEYLNYKLSEPNVKINNANDAEIQDEESTDSLWFSTLNLHRSIIDKRDKETGRLVYKAAEATQLDHSLRSSSLPFQFNQFIVAQIRPPLIAWINTAQEKESRIPIWAYIDGTWSSGARRERFSRYSRTSLRAQKIINGITTLDLDPLYISVLIAMAQVRMRYAQSCQPQSQKVFLFVPQHERTSNAHEWRTTLLQYTADISNLYLQKFTNPYQFYDATLQIEKRTLAINPPTQLQEIIKTAYYESAKPGMWKQDVAELARAPKFKHSDKACISW